MLYDGCMGDTEKTYIAIDLKSFYASVECVERGLNPLTAHLVVADPSRTEKTICLAVSPALKAHGVGGRPRLFEVVEKVKEVNALRRMRAPGQVLTGPATDSEALAADPTLALDYFVAPPRMSFYIRYSTMIYNVYLRFIAPEDIHVYSIDEVFMDVTPYLTIYGMSAHDLTMKIIREVLAETGITATAGIGTNLYLAKIAMDIVAKKMPPDEDGVRIAELNELSYRETLWSHRPLTDFWRIGRGYARKLALNGMYTMGDVARCSIGGEGDFHNEDLLYRLFGINAELLIDHAWGWEPCTIEDIRAFRPSSESVSSGQVLQRPYSFGEGKLIVREMTDLMVLDLVAKGKLSDRIVLYIGYDTGNLSDPARAEKYQGEVSVDWYGRAVPGHAHGTAKLNGHTSSTRLITDAVMELYDRIVDENLLIRRVTIAAENLKDASAAEEEGAYEQMDLFTDYAAKEAEEKTLEREKRAQEAVLEIRRRFGKNAMLKGMNFEEGAMTIERNNQIGGHKA